MDTPESMKAELAAWNNGAGIDIESWVGCEGKFSLAVGYSSIFGPRLRCSRGTSCAKDSLKTPFADSREMEGVANLLNGS